MYHKQLVEWLEKDLDYQQLTTNKLNQILHQTGELLFEYILQRTNKRVDGPITPKHKIILVDYADQSKSEKKSNNKKQLELFIKVVDHIITKSGLEKELSEMFD